MKNKKTIYKWWLLLCMALPACGQLNNKNKNMDNTTPKFGWALVLSAPREYPVEITEDNYLATDTSFITGITNIGGKIYNGWGGYGR